MKTTTQNPTTFDHDVSLQDSLTANELLKPAVLNKAKYQDLMDIKKAKEAEYQSFSKLFFFVGLSISLLAVTVAINWKTYDKLEMVDLGMLNAEFDDLIEVPVSTQPPPPPPKQNQPIEIVEVEDDVVIEEIDLKLDVEMTEETEVGDHNIDFSMEPVEEERVEEVFTIVENYPTPKGGMEAFYKYVGENINYPPQARRLGISGIVFVRFVVEKNGEITDVKIIRGIGAGCDEEAMRVLNAAPAWTPGKQRGRPVRVLMTVPIRFVLNDGN